MKCWKCGQEIADGTQTCVYCQANQRRSVPKTEAGRAMRALYDNYGAEKVLSTPVYLVSGIGDLVEDSRKLKNQLKTAMDAGIGKIYLEQLKTSGVPDKAFEERARAVLIEDAGLNDRVAGELTGYFDEMIGWKEADPDPETLRKESEYQRASNLINSQIISDVQEALNLLQKLSGYKDSVHLAEQCRVRIDVLQKERTYQEAKQLIGMEVFSKALQLLEMIQGYKDTDMLIRLCRNKLEESEKSKRERIKQEKIEKEKKTHTIIGLLTVVFIVITLLLLNHHGSQRQQIIRATNTAAAVLRVQKTQNAFFAAPTKTAEPTKTPAPTATKTIKPTATKTPVPTATSKPALTLDPHYEDIINFMGDYLRGKKGTRYEIGDDFSEAFGEVGYGKTSSDFGYILTDLDKDGKDELIFGSTKSYEVYDIYTIRNNSLVHLISGFYRANLRICKNNEINFRESYSAFDGHSVFYSLNNGKLNLLRNIFDYDSNQYYVSYESDKYVFDSSSRPPYAEKLTKTDFDKMYAACDEIYFTLRPF